ncbi:hypothetical protein [Desulfonatronovibrio magnus]|uniref:hypothetical protein n=1 Tax=Desulfonatronovibrio magnus TaxID=698827 RepID=UPI0005EB1625|nr:hypothetical protein [Desulfonatronovibrio magnus]
MSTYAEPALDRELTQEDWQIALNIRTCPPDTILFKETSENLTRHIRSCYMCQMNLEIQVDKTWSWPEVYQKLECDSGPEPGQVRKIRPELAGWGPKDRYYNPPLVLILEVVDEQAVRVAQIYPGEEFKTEDDTYLDGFGYAQSWNIYTLAVHDLEGLLGTIDSQTVQRIIHNSEKYFHAEENSMIYLFRCMETEVGSFFSQQSISHLIQSLEHEETEESKSLRNLVLKAIQKNVKVPGIEKSHDPLLEIARMEMSELKQAMPVKFGMPESVSEGFRNTQTLAMAASDKDSIQAKMIVLDETGTEFKDFQSGLVTIMSTDRGDDQLKIFGKVDPDFVQASEMFAWWDTLDGSFPADTVDLSEDHSLFTAFFPEMSRKDYLKGRLMVIFVSMDGD